MSKKHFSRFLDTVGDGTGTKEATGNYATPTKFMIVAAGNEDVNVARLIVGMSDAGSFDADSYGNGISLSNGIIIDVQDDDDNVLFSLTDPTLPIKTNAQWAHYCHDYSVHSFGVGDEHASARWTFEKSGTIEAGVYSQTPGIRLKDGQRLVVTLEDNFIALTGHHFLVQGRLGTEY